MAGGRAVIPPESILRLEPDEADALLDRLETTVPVRNGCFVLPSTSAAEAVVMGDTHGDWRSTAAAEAVWRSGDRWFVGLGDYVDRPPDDCAEGSVANALHLLALAGERPDRVVLLQGNHETVRRIPALPHGLAEEVDALWGPESSRYDRILGLLERGPLAAVTPNGAYLAHAGFPRTPLPTPWTAAFERPDDELLADLVWSEPDWSRLRRGATAPWTERELDSFLAASGNRIFVRGHDPDITGRPFYRGRCLTLHTTRVFGRFGGVVVGRVPLSEPLESVAQIRLEHLSTEGRTFDAFE